jgi:hypothetical protein
MRTLQEHIDDLDRMVDSGTAIPKIRNQIAFIGREVAALQADYASLAEAHTKLQDEHPKAIAALKEAHHQEIAKITASNAKPKDELAQKTREILVYFFNHADGVSDGEIARIFQMQLSMAAYHTDILLKKRFIDQIVAGYEAASAMYCLTDAGRKYVVDNGLAG